MICKIQVVTIGEDGHKETREITSIQRTDVKPETLGLTLADGKMILKDLQQVVVESQVCSGADGRRTILFRRGLPAELGRTSGSRWSPYRRDRWWLCPRAAQERTVRGDCRQEHLGF